MTAQLAATPAEALEDELADAVRRGDADAVMALADGCPTGAYAVLEVPGPWAALDGADARLVDFSVPGPGRR